MTSRYKILMTRKLLEKDKKYVCEGLRKDVGDCFELIEPPSYDEVGICTVVEDADVILGPYISKEIIKNAKKLKLIQIPWTGMDTFNFDAIRGTNITVCNSHSNSLEVAEFCVALIFDLLKKISYHDRKMRHGNWNRDNSPLDLGSELIANKTFCILGYGNIGSKVGKILSFFGSEIYAVNTGKAVGKEVSKHFLNSEMMDAVLEADVVINALPLTKDTKGLIDENFINSMKDLSYIVNISRAEIIDEESLYFALLNNKISGYASDVWWNSPKRGESLSYPSAKNKFEDLDQVVFSPHRAGFLKGGLPHLDDAIKNIANFIKKESLINVIDIEKNY